MRDIRAMSTTQLRPPKPLPHVSRAALKRVGDSALPPPKVCHYCSGPVKLLNHKFLYGHEYGTWPYVYACIACWAYVGLHPDTDLPLGTLANSSLRAYRKEAKNMFFKWLSITGMSRKQAYPKLAQAMSLPASECHFAHFNTVQCIHAKTICEMAIAKAEERNYDTSTKA